MSANWPLLLIRPRYGDVDTSPEEREVFHRGLDHLLDQRDHFRRASSDPDYRRFRPAIPDRGGPKVSGALAEGLLLDHMALRFMADVIGDEILQLPKPDRNRDARRKLARTMSALKAKFSSSLRRTRHPIQEHRLVGLLWLKWHIRNGPNRKGPKSLVGEAYGLGKDAISKWEPGCRKKLGLLFDKMMTLSDAMPPESFFSLVFGEHHGPKTLAECGEAYQACRSQLRKSGRRKQPRNSG